MARTVSERLDDIERDLSRILEFLQDAMTVDTASEQIEIADTLGESNLTRIRRIEQRMEAVRYKWQMATRKQNS